MIRRNADLHVHTTHSDGLCSPSEVVVAAAGVGLAALAITDHDTVSALAVARVEADRLGVELISGVELTCEYEGREIHVLGYFFRDDDLDLIAAMERLRIGRVSRFQVMADRLTELGMVVDLKAVRRCFPRAVLGRRHLAEYLARTRQVGGVRDAFDRFLADGRPACAVKPMLDAGEAIGLIRRPGASPPGLTRPTTSGLNRSERSPKPGSRRSRRPDRAFRTGSGDGSATGPRRSISSPRPARTSTPPTAPADGSARSPPPTPISTACAAPAVEPGVGLTGDTW